MMHKLVLAGLLSAAVIFSAPAAAQVRIQTADNVDYLIPNWLSLDDGSSVAIMATPDLLTTVMMRCWGHSKGTYCMKSSESWLIEGFVAHSVEWTERDDRPDRVIPVVEAPSCSQTVGKIKDDGFLPNCARLLERLYQGGPLALARLPITSVAPIPEDIPSDILRRTLTR